MDENEKIQSGGNGRSRLILLAGINLLFLMIILLFALAIFTVFSPVLEAWLTRHLRL